MRKDNSSCCTKISVCNLGLAVGLVWGLSMFATVYFSIFFGMGIPFVEIFSTIYLGYDFTFVGSLLGLFWGFIDGFIGGALVAFFYNVFSCCCPYSCGKKKRKSRR